MALSFSRPDPSQPSSVSSASFTLSRRGYDQAEVRDFLRMVAAELARLQEREKFLEHELRVAQRGGPSQAVALDEDVLTRMLGEEAARILQAARDGAASIKLRAEEHGQRIVREVTEEAERLRIEVEQEVQRRHQDSISDAEAEIGLAKQQGREMVNEARAYRERVLAELARRRDLAREQLEQLAHGRERLVQAFDRARVAAIDVLGELAPLIEPDEFVNLTPSTGPVPLMVPHRPVVVERREEAAPEPTVDRTETAPVDATAGLIYDVEAESTDTSDATAGEAALAPGTTTDLVQAATVDAGTSVTGSVDDGSTDVTAAVEPVASVEPATTDTMVSGDESTTTAEPSAAEVVESEKTTATPEVGAPAVDEPTVEVPIVLHDENHGDEHHGDDHHDDDDDDDRPIAPVVSLFSGAVTQPARESSVPPPPAAPVPPRQTVDDLFARLRAARPEHVAAKTGVAVDDEPAPTRRGRSKVITEQVDGATVVQHVAPDESASAKAERAGHPTSTGEPTSVRRRSGRAELPGAEAAAAGEPDADGETPFTRRDATLAPIIASAGRALKRVLADEQNDILELLRRKEPVRSLDAIVPASADHIARYLDAVADDLMAAALAGAATLSTGAGAKHQSAITAADALGTAREHLANTLVDTLRERLDRVVADAAGSNADMATALRTVYRDWKTHRIDASLEHAVLLAFGHGALAAVRKGSPVLWVVDPSAPPSADCDDNALAGAVPAGESFPTEHLCAPAHTGCRCMLVLAPR